MDVRGGLQTEENRREDLELYTLLTLERRSWDEGRPEVERQVACLVRSYMLRVCRSSTGPWNVLNRRCDICQQLQPSAQELLTHRYTAHSAAAANPTGRTVLYTCLICYNTFPCKHTLHTHIKRVHTPSPSTINPPLDYNNADPPPSTTRNRPFKCTVCPKAYTTQQYLQRHTIIHTGEKAYECDVCHKCFSQRSAMSAHKRIHAGETSYECDMCHKCFTRRIDMLTHKSIHTGKKLYECDVCYKCFTRRANMRAHKKIHTGEKLYECDVCHKRFMYSNYLNLHKTIHSGERPHKCDICYKRFMRRRQVFIHIKNQHRKNE